MQLNRVVYFVVHHFKKTCVMVLLCSLIMQHPLETVHFSERERESDIALERLLENLI